MPNLNFTISELIYSDTAIQNKINNMPDKNALDNLLYLIVYLLQPVRDKFGPIQITSGFRNPLVNRLVKGSETSNHLTGNAADIIPLKATFNEVYNFIVNNLDFDECLLENDSKGNKWLHVAYRHKANRKKSDPNFHALS